ncbi:MAG: Holliday junction branch migration protein RuvA [Proteobacteria bacterium]|nr:Holliday junction branch migration protein RuvA [Pseudomonadota bacterium]
MISQLRGTVTDIQGGMLTLDVGGVGYEICATRGLLSQLDSEVVTRVLVYTDVKQDSIRLFGFADPVEKQIFMLLLRVTGIGSRTALDIISAVDGRELMRAIGVGDTQRLQAIRGIGKKTAERIVLELRDKVADLAAELQGTVVAATGAPESLSDAIAALQALGFTKADAERAVRAASEQAGLAKGGTDPGVIVREALRFV